MTPTATEPAGTPPDVDAALRERLDALFEDGRSHWHRFDSEVRQEYFHPFVAADYDCVLKQLVRFRKPGRRFLEWGSATGVITIMADLLGFDACGIELDASLARAGRELAERTGSKARFATGSFIPTGWTWRPRDGDGRLGTIGQGPSGYLQLGRALSDFDVVYAYPWAGEEPMMLDLMRAHGHEDARLILHTTDDGTRVYHRGRLERGM